MELEGEKIRIGLEKIMQIKKKIVTGQWKSNYKKHFAWL